MPQNIWKYVGHFGKFVLCKRTYIRTACGECHGQALLMCCVLEILHCRWAEPTQLCRFEETQFIVTEEVERKLHNLNWVSVGLPDLWCCQRGSGTPGLASDGKSMPGTLTKANLYSAKDQWTAILPGRATKHSIGNISWRCFQQ